MKNLEIANAELMLRSEGEKYLNLNEKLKPYEKKDLSTNEILLGYLTPPSQQKTQQQQSLLTTKNTTPSNSRHQTNQAFGVL